MLKYTIESKIQVVLCVAASIVALAPICSQATDLNEAPQVRVSYADLNINSAVGASVLYARIKRAADSVCPADSKELEGHAAHTACTNKAIGDTVRDAGIVALSKLYTEKTGNPVAVRFASNNP